jgi:hypothetical protein
MVANRTRVRVTPETDFPTLLDDAEDGPILLERNGKFFSLILVDDISYEPDPDRVRRILAATAGSWADIDVDRVIEDIYEARRLGSWPSERP